MSEKQFAFDLQGTEPRTQRRLDKSLSQLQAMFDALPEDERARGLESRAISVIKILAALRGMELGEEAAGDSPVGSVADLYDQMVDPGQPLLESLVKVAVAAICPTVKDAAE